VKNLNLNLQIDLDLNLDLDFGFGIGFLHVKINEFCIKDFCVPMRLVY
jgi:hypothetical protein